MLGELKEGGGGAKGGRKEKRHSEVGRKEGLSLTLLMEGSLGIQGDKEGKGTVGEGKRT